MFGLVHSQNGKGGDDYVSSTQEKSLPKINELDMKFEFGGIKCPEPGCRQTLFEIEKSFLVVGPDISLCRKCGSKTSLLMYSYNETEPGKLIVRWHCSACREEFDRHIPSIRKYCKGCKKYQQIFLSVLIGLPQCEVTEL